MLEFEATQIGKVKVEFIDGRWKVSLQNGLEFFTSYLAEMDGGHHFTYLLKYFEENEHDKDNRTVIFERIFISIPQQIYEKMQEEYALYLQNI